MAKVRRVKVKVRERKSCFLCGKNGQGDPLELHHVFNGPYKWKSEMYGAMVYLCGEECHRNGKGAVHRNRAVSDSLKEHFQRKIMAEQGWNVNRFVEEFGKNYT